MLLTNTITTVGTRNGVNSLDFGLYTGAISYGYPVAGALNWFTNTKLSGVINKNTALIQSAYDLAYVTYGNGCFTIQPD